MNHKKIYQIILLSLGISIGHAATKLDQQQFEFGGVLRSYEYLYPNRDNKQVDVLFVLHGSRMDTSQMRWLTDYRFEAEAKRRGGLLVVYPQGYEKHWNGCRKTGNYQAKALQLDDIGFMREIIGRLRMRHELDVRSVFALGYSNGGQMAYRLGLEAPDFVDGIITVAANMPVDSNNICKPKESALPVFMINGTEDRTVPYKGGLVVVGGDASRGEAMSAMASLDYWRNRLDCNTLGSERNFEDINMIDGSTAKMDVYRCDSGDDLVQLLTLYGGGHTLPLRKPIQIPPNIQEHIGNTNGDADTVELTMEFIDSVSP